MEIVACGALIYLSRHFYALHTKTKDAEFISNARYLKNIAIGLFLTAVYTGFIDVPMYIKRYFEDTAANKEYIVICFFLTRRFSTDLFSILLLIFGIEFDEKKR